MNKVAKEFDSDPNFGVMESRQKSQIHRGVSVELICKSSEAMATACVAAAPIVDLTKLHPAIVLG